MNGWSIAAILTGVTTLVLAAFVIKAAPANRRNRAFALFLVLYGTLRVLDSFVWNGPPGVSVWQRFYVYLGLVDDVALLFFVVSYRPPHRWFLSGWATLSFAALALVMPVLFALDHSLAYGPMPPLLIADNLVTALAYSVAGGWLAYRGLRDQDRTASLVGAGLGAWGIPGALPRYLALIRDRAEFIADPLLSEGLWWIVMATAPLVLGGQLTMIVALSISAWREPGRFGASKLAFFLVFVGVVLAALRLLGIEIGSQEVALFFPAGVVLVGLAILRYSSVEFDIKLKGTISAGTVATAFMGVFFVVGIAASEYLVDSLGYGLGAIAAGLLFFAMKPLQSFGQRLAQSTLPTVEDTEAYRTVRKRDVYRAAFESAARDGSLTEREKDTLAALQEQLGLKPTEVRAIEKAI